jgi:hypothetical protein
MYRKEDHDFKKKKQKTAHSPTHPPIHHKTINVII